MTQYPTTAMANSPKILFFCLLSGQSDQDILGKITALQAVVYLFIYFLKQPAKTYTTQSEEKYP